jgi:hypothetical protein
LIVIELDDDDDDDDNGMDETPSEPRPGLGSIPS